MEGVQPSRKRIGRVQRVFENSRLGEELLATAYQRVLPEQRIQLIDSKTSSPTEEGSKPPCASVMAICQFTSVFASEPIAIGGQS
jgi:hypothetical protein